MVFVLMEWDSKYELGHDRIDAEHRIFLSLIMDFEEALSQDASKEKLNRILKELTKYAKFHFVSEENIMAEHNYPDLEKHAYLHLMLLTEVRNYSNQFMNDMVEATEVFGFLFNWFAFHTVTEDKKLIGFIGK